MNRVDRPGTLRALTFAVTVCASLACASGCGVEVGAEYPAGYYDDYPSDAYIATVAPVYFEGRPAYWYHDHWYYRDGGRWNHYDREPAVLYQRRTASPVVRRNYEPGWGHATRASGYRGGGRGRR